MQEPLYDLGVLFVHGIGQSAQGETLVRFGEPLREAIERFAAPSALESTDQAASAAVASAWLSTPPGEGPARAELHIEGCRVEQPPGPALETSGTSSRWLFAEAWWAGKFPTPTFAQIASWTLGVLPPTLVAHFDRRFRRIGFAFVRNWRVKALSSDTAVAVGRLFMEGVIVTFALALTPLLLMAIGGLLIIGLAPFTAARNFAASLQRKLAATVGDSYVFMQQRITAATICTCVRERLEWLAARCRRVAVVAHSQGGAIAHSVLRSAVTAPCDVLVTFGSGLAKLAEIERGDAARGRGALWFASFGSLLAALGAFSFIWRGWHMAPGLLGLLKGLVPSFVIFEIGGIVLIVLMARLANSLSGEPAAAELPSALTATRSGVRPLQPLAFGLFIGILDVLRLAIGQGPTLSFWPEAPLAAMLGLGLGCAYEGLTAWHGESERFVDPARQWRRDRALFLDDFEFRNRRMAWYDLYASADPVPNGHLLDDFEPRGLVSIKVRNRHSLLGDHTSYWQASDDFVHRVARILMREAKILTRSVDSMRAARRRIWRVGWLVAARWVLGLAALGLAAQWMESPPSWLRSLYDRLPDNAASTRHAWDGVLSSAAPAIAVLALWISLFGFTIFRWQQWERTEIESFNNRRDYPLASKGLWWTMSAPMVLFSFAVATTAGINVAAAAILAVGVLIGGICLSSRARDLVQRLSRSGAELDLSKLDLDGLRAQRDKAVRRRDKVALTSIGRQLEGLDDELAAQTLHLAAFEFKHANAAWALGGLHDEAARNKSDPAEKRCEWQLAVDAYIQGASLGDPLSARWAAYRFKDLGEEDREYEYYRRAYELKDAAAAHSVGSQLMKQGRRDEARVVYEDGIRRGDSLCAVFLARHLESLAAAAEGDQAADLKRQAAEKYQIAFDLGYVEAAKEAGNLLRRMGDFAGARRSYTLGANLRDSSAALLLGKLEQEEEEDVEAAFKAYASVGRIDRLGPDTAEALMGIGALLEKLGRLQAAKARYRAALWVKNGRHVSAKAGMALARLLEPLEAAGRNQAKLALQRASSLAPKVAADAYISFLQGYEKAEIAALTSQQIEGLSAGGLVKLAALLKFTEPQRARSLLERAVAMDSFAGSVEATVELHRCLIGAREYEDAGKLIDDVIRRSGYFAAQVIELMEARGSTAAAAELRRRLKP